MPTPSLHFLGWNRPVVETVCDFLLADAQPDDLFDLDGTLLVVPTQQAGRHLLDALVQRCDTAGVAVLSQRVVTPSQLAADALRRPDIASGAEILMAWSEVLAAADEPLLVSAFGASGRAREPAVVIAMAERLQLVRRELAEAAHACATVAAHADAASAEQERWQALAQLESAFLARLAQAGLRDPCAAQIAWATNPPRAPEWQRIVVACVPDPSLLLVRALETLASFVTVNVLVQAPTTEATHFDCWGRPHPEHWNTCRIEIPNEEENLLLAADPAGQASRIVEIMAAEASCKSDTPRLRFTVADTAIGVPDRATIPFLVNHLAACGVSAFDPQERPLREHPLCRLIELLLDLRRAAPYRTIADLLRHPDVLNALQQEETENGRRKNGKTEEHSVSDDSCKAPVIDPAQLLTQLDTFQNQHLPLGLPDMLRPFASNPRGSSNTHADFTLLGQVLQRVAGWRDRLVSERLPVVLRALLSEIYANCQLNPEVPADRLFAAAAEAIDRVLREEEDARLPTAASENETAILRTRLRSQGCAPERSDELLDLEGWLELPWNRAPLLLVAGMNEGRVPDGRLADDFLPDTLRRSLALRDDRQRAARDAFLLQVLLAARAEGRGRVCLLCGKSSAEGDPLRPSRLLFRCQNAQLPQRARRLFGSLPATRPGAPATTGFRLDPFALGRDGSPSRPPSRPPSAPTTLPFAAQPPISATQFKDYLQCPFRFYLRHHLQMAPLADDQLAPDERAFGTLVHGVLQDFAHDPQMARCTDTAKLAARLRDLAMARFAACYGARPSLTVLVARESAIQRLARFATIQAVLAQEWEIVAHEKKFTLQRGGREIVARIDRLDRHCRDGRLRVMDYKTFDKVKFPVDAHIGPCRTDTPAFAQVETADERGRIWRKAWQDLQLPLYREAVVASGLFATEQIELGFFVLPRAIGETGFYPWSEYTDTLHAAALSCADGVLAALTAETFWPPREVPAAWDDFAALFTDKPEQCFVPQSGRAGPPDPPQPPEAPP